MRITKIGIYKGRRFVQRMIDKTLNRQKEEREKEQAYIKLNNLYLAIEHGDITLNRQVYNILYLYLHDMQPDSLSTEYWGREFHKLPGWLDV